MHWWKQQPESGLLRVQQARADTASSSPTPPAKKMTVWKKLKKALFNPGKSSKREATAQQLMQAGPEAAASQRYSEKHADQSDGVVSYSRKTSFQEARENQTPAYRSVVTMYSALQCKMMYVSG